MRKLLTIFLAFSLLITVFTVNTFADEKNGASSNEGQNASSRNIEGEEPTIEGDAVEANSQESRVGEPVKYVLRANYSYDDDTEDTYAGGQYSAGEYGYILSLFNGYEVVPVGRELRYYTIESITIGSNPVDQDKLKIVNGENGYQEYYFLMGEEDTEITISFRLDHKEKIEDENKIFVSWIVNWLDGSTTVGDNQMRECEIVTGDDGTTVLSYSVYTLMRTLQLKSVNVYLATYNEDGSINSIDRDNPIDVNITKNEKDSNQTKVSWIKDPNKQVSDYYFEYVSNELPDYTIEQNENDDVVLTFDSKEFAESVKHIRFEEVSKSRAGTESTQTSDLIREDNKIIIKYNVISDVLHLKSGSTYRVSLFNEEFLNVHTSKEYTLKKGINPSDIVATVDNDSNLIISAGDNFNYQNITFIHIHSERYDGYDQVAIFAGDELIRENNRIFVLGDYIKTYNLKSNADYTVEVGYTTGNDREVDSSNIILNTVRFDYEQLIGPKLVGYVNDGLLYIDSVDKEGEEYLNAFYDNRNKNFNDELVFNMNLIDGKMEYHLPYSYMFKKYQNGLLFPLYSLLKDSESFDISDDNKLTLRVPGKGVSEIIFAIDEDSMKLDSLTIIQDEIGNIIISADPSLKLESVNSVVFFSLDLSESNVVKYHDYFTDIYDEKTGNLVIPYSYIKASNLKGETDYRIFIWYDDDSSREISNSFRLNKGSQLKEMNSYSVSENNKGDIVITVDDPSFLNYKIDICLKESEGLKSVRFESDDVIKDLSSKTITIPYDLIKKSQLSKGQYDVEFDGFDFYVYFLSFYVPSTIEITRGSQLDPIPEFTIEQKDNGDIVLSSESQELINHIERIKYSKPYIKAGPNAFLENSLIKGNNELVIPYQVVKYSWLEPGITYTFEIEFDDDSVFYYDERSVKELFIKTGSMLLNSEKMSIGNENNVVYINFENQDDLKKLENETYLITHHVWGSVEKETAVSKNSLVFDYSNNKVYIINELKDVERCMFNLMDKETCLAYGEVYYSSTPQVDTGSISEKLYLDKIKKDAASYIEKLYPETRIIIDGVSASEYSVASDSDVDKYFKVYGLSPDNTFVIDVSMCADFRLNGLRYAQKVPYDYPNEFVEVKLTLSLEQMAKLGITNDNWSTQNVTVLREHNGAVDELAATVEPVTVNGTIISFKVTFQTDKMSLFALANKNSIVRPSSGGSGSGSSSATTPAKKPVVNTSAK